MNPLRGHGSRPVLLRGLTLGANPELLECETNGTFRRFVMHGAMVLRQDGTLHCTALPFSIEKLVICSENACAFVVVNNADVQASAISCPVISAVLPHLLKQSA